MSTESTAVPFTPPDPLATQTYEPSAATAVGDESDGSLTEEMAPVERSILLMQSEYDAHPVPPEPFEMVGAQRYPPAIADENAPPNEEDEKSVVVRFTGVVALGSAEKGPCPAAFVAATKKS